MINRLPIIGNILKKISSNQEFIRFKNKFKNVGTQLSDGGRFTCRWDEHYFIKGESLETTDFDAHYVYHTAWAARILAKTNPNYHVDISSDLRFVTLVSAFIPIDFYDYRPVDFSLSGLKSKHADLMALPFDDNSVASISCMHVVEHIGLERYGDPFDPQGDIKAINELLRVVKTGGYLFFVVPVGGRARIQYNAHRIYTFEMVCSLFKNLHLDNFALITDNGTFIENATPDEAEKQEYGCGCFLFKKKI
jgi:SAM-dependent methyltransferase